MSGLRDALADLATFPGTIGVALIDPLAGTAVAAAPAPGHGGLRDAAPGVRDLMRAVTVTLAQAGATGGLEEMVLTLDDEYHVLRLLPFHRTGRLVVHLRLDRASGNLPLASRMLRTLDLRLGA